jgi:hypothetical protein
MVNARRQRWQVWTLIGMSLVGVTFGIWLCWAGFPLIGSLCLGVFLWRAQQFALWLVAPRKIPSDIAPTLSSWWERFLLWVICLLGMAVCAVGIYVWRFWPEEWQAGLVFLLFGLVILAPVTIREIQLRRRAIPQVQAPRPK